MIQATQDFNEAIAFIKSDFVADIRNFEKTMSSSDFNASWQYVEYELNLLYEKTRVLEDCLAYAKKSLEEDIAKRRLRLEEKMRTIQQHAASYQDRSYIATTVSLLQPYSQASDRDGSLLPIASYSGGEVSIKGAVIAEYAPDTCQRSGALLPYRNNINELQHLAPYRSFYVEPAAVLGGVKETIRINFAEARQVNHIEAKPVGCVIEAVRLVNRHGQLVPAAVNRMIGMTEAVAIEIDLRSELTSLRKFTQCDDSVIEQESRLGAVDVMAGQSIEEAEKLQSLNAARAEYDSYLKKLTSWSTELSATRYRNRMLAKQGG